MKMKMPKQGIAFGNNYPAAIIALFLLAVSFDSFSQIHQPPSLWGKRESRQVTDSAWQGPTGSGAPTSSNITSRKQFGLYFDSTNKKMYYYNPKLAAWDTLQIGVGGSGSSIAVSDSAWSKTGNAGTDTSVNGIGTTDNVDLPIKTNGTRRFTVNTNGALGIGAAPDYGTSGYLLQSAGSAASPAWVDHATLSTPLSKISAAVATNSVDHTTYAQTWAWTGLTGTAMTWTSTSTAASNNQTLFSLTNTGANASSNRTTYTGSFTNSHSGTGAANIGVLGQATSAPTTYAVRTLSQGTTLAYGVYSIASGSTENVAGYFASNSGANNYSIIVPSGGGNVGIGTQAPTAGLHHVGTAKFDIGSDATGDIWYRNSSGFFTRLPIGTSAQTLHVSGGLPAWSDTAVAGVSPTNTVTLTNKRWTARVGSTTSSATPTINTDNYDVYKLTAQTNDITSFTTNLSGTPADGDILEIQITGTAARAITWGSSFVSTTVTLPTTTTTTVTLTVIFQYYTTSSYGNNKWHCVNYY